MSTNRLLKKRSESIPLLSQVGGSASALANSYPAQFKGFRSTVLFSWLTPLLELGNQRPLEFGDLYQLNPDNRAENISIKFQETWANEIKNKTKPRLWWALAKAFGGKFALAGILKLFHDALQFVGPMVIKDIIAFLSQPEAPLSEGFVYVAIITVSGIVQSFALRQYFYYCFETGLKLRSSIVTSVYKKSLVLSSLARQKKSTGEITNFMSIDAQRLQDLTPYFHGLWYALFQIIVSSFLLYIQLGVSFLAGVAVIILVIPTTAGISQIMRKLQQRLMKVKDERIKICFEVLSGIKVIKLQAWENSFVKRVMEYRSDELSKLGTYIYTRAFSDTVFGGVTPIVTIVTFLTYILLGNKLDVGTALTSLALFNILRFPLFMLPQVINNLVEATVSFKRLEDFLLDEERVPVSSGVLTDTGIEVSNASFVWDSNDTTEVTLANVDLKIRRNELCAVVGHVGSGKSTLVSGILGDAFCASGSVAMYGSVAYVSQQPFIQNATLKDNILFGLPFDSAKYAQAVEVSCLMDDLRILPGGDMTEIGEKGINLSGGQRTRVAIARAVYQNADIYILDDPLAAVDSHVGADIFNNCIKGALKDKLVLFVTNGLTFLNQCDHIVVLENARVAEQGSFGELVETDASKEGVLAKLLYSLQDVPKDEETLDDENGASEAAATFGESAASNAQQSASTTVRDRSISSRSESNANAQNDSKLIADEDRSVGDVAWAIYKVWINACGGVGAAVFVLFVFILSQLVNLISTMWLSYWSEQTMSASANTNGATTATNATSTSNNNDTITKVDDSAEMDQMYYLNVFIGLNILYTLMLFGRSVFLYMSGLRGSKILFQTVLERVLRAPMSFFDTTPLGRIVNRLSKDVYAADETIPATWSALLSTLIGVVTTLGTIVYVTPLFTTILIPLFIGYYMAQRYFIKTSRELQRLDSISRSPVYALLTETLDGMATIRAYHAESKFIARNNDMLDKNQRAYFLNFAANCWLALRLEFAGTMVGTFAALFAVLGHESTNSVAFAGLAGVSLSYAFSVTQTLNWSVRMISQLQTQMVSVERIHAYSIMPTERELRSDATTTLQLANQKWPEKGQVTFNQVNLRYRPGLPRVLRNLTFTINPHEKIGVVGRTGAGKSSLVVALMRLVEIDQGSILLDGVDISTIGLHDLRDKISIIPQDPVLFSGTIRSNLDPFDKYNDAQLWASVKRAHLDRSVQSLDSAVDERGSNFSVGERQLICIARALLKKSSVILMDEATASIDATTDRLIQQSIREEFSACTCLTIAHRINTIMDADRILVMDQGYAAEFDTPNALLQMPQGIFASLVKHWQNEEKK